MINTVNKQLINIINSGNTRFSSSLLGHRKIKEERKSGNISGEIRIGPKRP